MNESQIQRDVEDIKEEVKFVRTDIWEISELADNFIVNIRSIFAMVIILIVFASIGLNPPIETNNLLSIILSFLCWWSFVCLATAVIVVPLFFLAIRKRIDIKIELISRISLVLVVILSLLPQIAPLISPAGLVGVIIEVVLYLVFGRWFVIPGEPFTRFYKGSKMARERLAEESLSRVMRDTNTIPNTIR